MSLTNPFKRKTYVVSLQRYASNRDKKKKERKIVYDNFEVTIGGLKRGLTLVPKEQPKGREFVITIMEMEEWEKALEKRQNT